MSEGRATAGVTEQLSATDASEQLATTDASEQLATTVVDRGDEEIVFLHGLMGRGKNFAAIAQALPFRSLLVDAPNHAESPWTERFSYTDMARRTAHTIAQRCSGPVTVVGHSMGGKTAMVLALEFPDLVSKLVVEDISPVPRGSRGEFRELLSAVAALPVDTLKSRQEADAALARAVPDATTRAFLLQNLVRTDRGFRLQPNLRLLLDSLDEVLGFPETSKTFAKPTLWIRGENSPYIQDADLPVMEALFPDTVPVTIPGASHWVHSDQPERFVATLLEFLRE